MLVPVSCPAAKLSATTAQFPVVPLLTPAKLYVADCVLPPTDTVTVPPVAAEMLLSAQLCWKVQVEGADPAGLQETVPAGVAGGAGEKDSVGCVKVPVPVIVNVPATVTVCVARAFVTVSW